MGKEDVTGKKFDNKTIVSMIILVVAFAISVFGLIRNTDIYRGIIYFGQCLACVLIFAFGIMKFKDAESKIFKIVLISYALLEALRASLLNITGVHFIFGAIARLVLVCLACTCVLVADRMGNKPSKKMAIGMTILEIILYIVFLVGFPGVMLGRMNRFLPLAGVLIAASIALLQKNESMNE